ncbi:MAG: chemotaxis protein CheD [Halodesulfurarchaeum sp.]
MEGPDRVRVGVADAAVASGNAELVTSGLGSCVGVALFDGRGVGGLLHAMLPDAPESVDNPWKYVDSGVGVLVSELERRGASRDELTGKLTGGSSMLDLGGGEPIGEKNVRAAKRVLEESEITLAADETGGASGRSVRFHPRTGVLRIKRVDSAVMEI